MQVFGIKITPKRALSGLAIIALLAWDNFGKPIWTVNVERWAESRKLDQTLNEQSSKISEAPMPDWVIEWVTFLTGDFLLGVATLAGVLLALDLVRGGLRLLLRKKQSAPIAETLPTPANDDWKLIYQRRSHLNVYEAASLLAGDAPPCGIISETEQAYIDELVSAAANGQIEMNILEAPIAVTMAAITGGKRAALEDWRRRQLRDESRELRRRDIADYYLRSDRNLEVVALGFQPDTLKALPKPAPQIEANVINWNFLTPAHNFLGMRMNGDVVMVTQFQGGGVNLTDDPLTEIEAHLRSDLSGKEFPVLFRNGRNFEPTENLISVPVGAPMDMRAYFSDDGSPVSFDQYMDQIGPITLFFRHKNGEFRHSFGKDAIENIKALYVAEIEKKRQKPNVPKFKGG